MFYSSAHSSGLLWNGTNIHQKIASDLWNLRFCNIWDTCFQLMMSFLKPNDSMEILIAVTVTIASAAYLETWSIYGFVSNTTFFCKVQRFLHMSISPSISRTNNPTRNLYSWPNSCQWKDRETGKISLKVTSPCISYATLIHLGLWKSDLYLKIWNFRLSRSTSSEYVIWWWRVEVSVMKFEVAITLKCFLSIRTSILSKFCTDYYRWNNLTVWIPNIRKS